jgi:hypothetical protein
LFGSEPPSTVLSWNLSIADRLEVAPNTVIKWRKRFFDEGVGVWGSETLSRLVRRHFRIR